MPRHSHRHNIFAKTEAFFKKVLLFTILDDDSDDIDVDSQNEDELSIASGNTLEDVLLHTHVDLQDIESNRYLFRNPYRPSSYALPRYRLDLHEGDDDEVPWLNNVEFLRKYRMSRDAFKKLLLAIKDDIVFQPTAGTKKKQRAVAYQLMTCLKLFGEEGTGSSAASLRDVFATGRGTSLVYIRRVVAAIRRLRDEYVSWPDADERRLIAHRIYKSSGLPNCVGIVDGTLFPLAVKPKREDHADYKGRKHGYSLSGIFINDDRRLIRYYAAGWPGCTHDNRIAGNTKLWKNPAEFLAPNEYIIGDSAFEINWFILSAFSCPSGATMSPEHTLFNKHLSKSRVTSEHTLGLLKGRFPWLRSIRKNITENKKTLKEVLLWLDACVILHNFLLKNNVELYEEDWIDDEDSVFDDSARRPEGDDELNLPVPNNFPPDYRRTQVLYFLQEQSGI